MMYRDPTFDNDQMQITMIHLYLDNISRSGGANGKIAGRSVAMAAGTLTCSHCGKEGHVVRNCWKKKDANNSKSTGAHDKQKNNESSKVKPGSKDTAEQKWCAAHKTTSHGDAE